jgi:hypothetical protein
MIDIVQAESCFVGDIKNALRRFIGGARGAQKRQDADKTAGISPIMVAEYITHTSR